MAEILSRLIGPANIGSGTNTAFTGTAAHTYSFRSLRVVNDTSATITLKIGIGGVADANLVFVGSIPATSVLQDDALFVLSGTETLQTNASATGSTLTMCGLDQS